MAADDERADRLAVRFGFRAGRCELALSGAVSISAHWLGNGFRHLVQAVEDLVDGRPDVSVRWGDELGAGTFIELSCRADDVSIAVHATSSGDPWSAERGECLFRASSTMRDLVVAVAAELHRVRVEDVDQASGIPDRWPHTFPFTAAERIEAHASRWFGYRPLSTVELRGAGGDVTPGPLLIGPDGEEQAFSVPES